MGYFFYSQISFDLECSPLSTSLSTHCLIHASGEFSIVLPFCIPAKPPINRLFQFYKFCVNRTVVSNLLNGAIFVVIQK